jgi:hypothetical protein
MWRVTAGNGLPRCEGYRWARFGPLGRIRLAGRPNVATVRLTAVLVTTLFASVYWGGGSLDFHHRRSRYSRPLVLPLLARSCSR